MDEIQITRIVNEICRKQLDSFRKSLSENVPDRTAMIDFLTIFSNSMVNIYSNMISYISEYSKVETEIIRKILEEHINEWFEEVKK